MFSMYPLNTHHAKLTGLAVFGQMTLVIVFTNRGALDELSFHYSSLMTSQTDSSFLNIVFHTEMATSGPPPPPPVPPPAVANPAVAYVQERQERKHKGQSKAKASAQAAGLDKYEEKSEEWKKRSDGTWNTIEPEPEDW